MDSAAAAGIFFSVIGIHEITIGTNSLQSLSLWERSIFRNTATIR